MKTLICIGDSLTEGADIPTGHTWPTLVANSVGIEVCNRGIGGDTTSGMLARFYPEVVVNRPNFVFIMGGTNDLWWSWEVNTILGNLFSMVFQARHHGITSLIGLPIPVNVTAAKSGDFSPPLDGYDRLTEKMGALAEALVFHATESEVPVVDLRRPFLTDRQKIRADRLLADGLHPNTAGHQAIASEMASVFRRDFYFM